MFNDYKFTHIIVLDSIKGEVSNFLKSQHSKKALTHLLWESTKWSFWPVTLTIRLHKVLLSQEEKFLHQIIIQGSILIRWNY